MIAVLLVTLKIQIQIHSTPATLIPPLFAVWDLGALVIMSV